MIPHPKTMQMVTDQRWHELQGEVARERLGMVTLPESESREPFHCPPLRRAAAGYVAAWSTALASVTCVLRTLPRLSRLG